MTATFSKLYLRDTVAAGAGLTYPTAQRASNTKTGNANTNTAAGRILNALEAKATVHNAAATQTDSSQNSVAGNYWFETWVSPQLGAQTLGGSITLSVGTLVNGRLGLYAYLWRPSTGAFVSELYGTSGALTQLPAAHSFDGNEYSYVTTVSLASGVAAASGDVICIELWGVLNGAGGVYVYFSGSGTEYASSNTIITAATDPAAYVSFSQPIYKLGYVQPGPLLAPVSFASTGSADFGRDILAFPGLDTSLTPVGGSVVLLDALARRFVTARGQLWAHPNYGTDLRQYLNAGMSSSTLLQLRQACEQEALKDERVNTCSCAVSYDVLTQRARLRVSVTTSQGPFSLTLAVTALTVELLAEQ